MFAVSSVLFSAAEEGSGGPKFDGLGPAEVRAAAFSLPKISAIMRRSPRPASTPTAKERAASEMTAAPNAHHRRLPPTSLRMCGAGSRRANADSRARRAPWLAFIAGATISARGAAGCSESAGTVAGAAAAGAVNFSGGAAGLRRPMDPNVAGPAGGRDCPCFGGTASGATGGANSGGGTGSVNNS